MLRHLSAGIHALAHGCRKDTLERCRVLVAEGPALITFTGHALVCFLETRSPHRHNCFLCAFTVQDNARFELSCNVSSIYFELQTSLLCAPWVQPQHLPTSAISVVRKSFDARKVRNTPRKTHKPEDRCARACVCVCVCAHARVCSRHHLLVSCSARNVLLACFWEAGATQLLLQM